MADAADVDGQVAELTAEMTRLRDEVARLLVDRSRHDRDVRAAARRTAQDDAQLWADHHFRHLIDTAAQDVTGLIYRVGQLGDRATALQVRELKDAAQAARLVLASARQRAERAPDYAGRVRREVDRLRAYIVEAGQKTHAEAGGDPAGCRCGGCELIRGMDQTGAPA